MFVIGYWCMLLAAEQTNDLPRLPKETANGGKRRSVARPVPHRYNTFCAVVSWSKVTSFPFAVYWFSSQTQWALCACVPVLAGEPWNVFCLRLYCDNIFPSESQAALCSGATFPCPLTGHTLSAGYATNSHTKGPLKYQFVYSSVWNVPCAAWDTSDSPEGEAASVLMPLASVTRS